MNESLMRWTNMGMMGRGYGVVDDKPIVQCALNSYYASEEKIAHQSISDGKRK